jgi:hypothetical protein
VVDESGINGTPTRERRKRPKWADVFIAALRKHGGGVDTAVQEAGIGRTTAYNYRYASDSFADEWEAAMREGRREMLGELKTTALERATRGTREPVGWYKGTPGGYVQKFSEQLTMFMLRAHFPDQYNIVPGDVTGGATVTAEQRARDIRAHVQALEDSIPGGEDG